MPLSVALNQSGSCCYSLVATLVVEACRLQTFAKESWRQHCFGFFVKRLLTGTVSIGKKTLS
eukprot:6470800-Amphidinium_carterae.2